MSSGQSARNGNSVEPGLPNTFLMPKPRSRSSVACLTVTDLLALFADLLDRAMLLCVIRHCEEQGDEAIHTCGADAWIASRSLSSGARSRDPLARNDDLPRRGALHGRLTR